MAKKEMTPEKFFNIYHQTYIKKAEGLLKKMSAIKEEIVLEAAGFLCFLCNPHKNKYINYNGG